MQIKEVVERTGVNAKTIRYYESSGLLKVSRDDNFYRNYTEEHVEQLLQIRLLRSFDVSIKQIEAYFTKSITLNQLLEQQYQELEHNDYTNQIKKDLCLSIKNTIQSNKELNVSDYQETVTYIESEEAKEDSKIVSQSKKTSLFTQWIYTLILSGPTLNLLLAIDMKQYDNLFWLTIGSVVSNILITLTWVRYLKYRKEHKEVNKGNWKLGILLIVSLVVMFSYNILIVIIQEKIMIDSAFTMYVVNDHFTLLVILQGVQFMIIMGSYLYQQTGNIGVEHLSLAWTWIKKYKYICGAINLCILYLFISTVTYFKDDQIIVKDALHPLGNTYTLEDIDYVETGFHQKGDLLRTYEKGQFFYHIYLSNGHVVNLSMPTPNESIKRYEENTYLEIEEYDQLLMSKGIKKKVIPSTTKPMSLDQQYIDRFKRIINLQ